MIEKKVKKKRVRKVKGAYSKNMELLQDFIKKEKEKADDNK